MDSQKCQNAQKNGEVVGPSGGENGGPRSLAEVYIKAAKTALVSTHSYYIVGFSESQAQKPKNSKKHYIFPILLLWIPPTNFCRYPNPISQNYTKNAALDLPIMLEYRPFLT